MTTKWVFDPEPPSGQRTGGSAAEYSFKGGVDILAREVIQNSLDAKKGSEAVGVTFRFVQLTDEMRGRFLEAISWETIEDNLRAAPEERGGGAIKSALAQMESTGLRLLIVEDTGTKGLEGTEKRSADSEKNPFCALVKDELYSDKGDETSGGSFGLGKSVLWAFSGLKTVLFSSVPATHPDGKSGLRFCGRTALPWHTTEDDGACTGAGWFGRAVGPNDASRRAESLWGAEAAAIASDCLCARADGDTGLSAVILGYSEPGESDRPLTEEADLMVGAVLESFWPAITLGALNVAVQVEENGEVVLRREVSPSAHPGYRQLGELLTRFHTGKLGEAETLEPGQEAFSKVTLGVPKRMALPQHNETVVKAVVLVRVLEDGEDCGEALERIFKFRKPGMVVRSDSQRNLSLGARPFIAAVLAGEAAGASENDKRAEQFLRAAEPPAHDEWTHKTRRIKLEYGQGASTRLSEFEKGIRDVVRRLVSKPEEKGGGLPRDLLKHLRFSTATGGPNARFLSVTHQKATVVDGSWHFSTRCRRLRVTPTPWHVLVRLNYGRDGGGSDPLKAIGSIDATDSTRLEIRNGVAYLEFPPHVEETRVVGRTDQDMMPAIGTRARLSIQVDAAAGAMPDV